MLDARAVQHQRDLREFRPLPGLFRAGAGVHARDGRRLVAACHAADDGIDLYQPLQPAPRAADIINTEPMGMRARFKRP